MATHRALPTHDVPDLTVVNTKRGDRCLQCIGTPIASRDLEGTARGMGTGPRTVFEDTKSGYGTVLDHTLVFPVSNPSSKMSLMAAMRPVEPNVVPVKLSRALPGSPSNVI